MEVLHKMTCSNWNNKHIFYQY